MELPLCGSRNCWRIFGSIRRPFRNTAASISGKCRQKGEKNYSGLFDDLLMAYTSRSALERVRTVSMGTLCELTDRVVLRRADREKELIDVLRTRNGNLTVTLGIVPREKNEL